MQRKRSGFTLVELLVVIGIIAVLISILLPSLSKARQQAQSVACKSGERQFYTLWSMYANDYKQSVLPCYYQVTGGEFDWWNYDLLGVELNRASPRQSGVGLGSIGSASGDIIKYCLRCPSADHSSDPDINGLQTNNSNYYFGDYVYNYFMGVSKVSGATFPVYAQNPKLGSVPGNVILLMESMKPNLGQGATPNVYNLAPLGYKDYFNGWTLACNNNAGSVSVCGLNHRQNQVSTMNILSADGHVSTLNPFTDPTTGGNTGSPTPQTGVLGHPYAYANTPTWNNYLIGPSPFYDSSGYVPPAAPVFAKSYWDKTLPGLP